MFSHLESLLKIQMLVILSCLFCLLECGNSLYFNSPTILLTYNYGIASNFTLKVLEAEDTDCFDWKSLNSNVVVVDPICDAFECCREAVVSVVSSAPERRITQVRATVKGKTASPLKCHVITDTPHSIELSTVTETMFVSGPPLLVTVVAKDISGKMFTSINGLILNWKVSNFEDGEDCVKLRPVPKFNKHNFGLQERGLLGHRILLEAENSGSFHLSASITNRDLLDLQTPDLKFEVSSNIRIHPSNSINLMKMASANIYLEDIGKEIKLDDSEAILETAQRDAAILQVDKDSVTALELGETKLTVLHKNIKYPVDIKIVKPTHLRFRISGGDFTVLEERKIYIIGIEILDEDGLVLYPSDNLRIAAHFPSSLFYVNHTSSNGAYHIVQALVPGKGLIKAELKGIIKPDGSGFFEKEDLFASIEIQVCQSVTITPPHFLLPLDANTIPLHEIRLMMSGGSGGYKLTLDDKNSSASVHFDEENKHVGYLNIFKGIEKITVIVTDLKNPNLIAYSVISLRPVIDIEVYPVIVETQIGNVIMLPVSLLAYENKDEKIIRKFDDCSKIQPSLEIIDKNVISLDESGPHVPAFGRGCLSLQFKCLNPGYSRINAFYEDKTVENKEKIKKMTTTVLQCYKTLKPVHPVRVAVLPLGATKEIAFEGGPRKWQLYKAGHFEKLEVTNPETLNVSLISDPIRYNKDLSVFRVTCLKLGENTLTLRKGNEPSPTNPHPAKEETSIKLICSEPYSVHLKLAKKTKTLQDNIVKVPFYGDKIFQVDIWLKDSKGRKLSNISSTLDIEFEVSDKSLADVIEGGLTTYENAVAGYRRITRDFQEFKMSGETGNLKVTAKVKSYRKNVLENMVIKYDEFNEISESLDLKLVSLRDINAGLYSQEDNEIKDEEGTCDEDSCKS